MFNYSSKSFIYAFNSNINDVRSTLQLISLFSFLYLENNFNDYVIKNLLTQLKELDGLFFAKVM